MNFSSGGHWNSSVRCDGERHPVSNGSYGSAYPRTMVALESVIDRMRTRVIYLNITMMSNSRKDGHPSVYNKPKEMRKHGDVQDCINWCLPGVPDAWNEVLYAMLSMDAQTSTEEYPEMEK